MVNCSIDGCKSRVGRDKISFYAPPAILTRQCEVTMELSECRRKIWFERIYWPGFDETGAPRYVRVCANHFVNGKPSALFDVANADWAPCINLGKTHCGLAELGQLRRNPVRKKKVKPLPDSGAVDLLRNEEIQSLSEEIESEEDVKRIELFVSPSGVGCQTDITCEGFARLEDLYKKVLEENIALRREVATLKTLVEGPGVIDDAAMHSGTESPTAGLEKVEVILKMEPEPEMDSLGGIEVDPLLEDPLDPLDPLEVQGIRNRNRNENAQDAVVEFESEPRETQEPERRPRQRIQQKRAKKYLCSECGQKFISKQALDIHSRIHTGERPFECPVCQRGFSVMSTLKAHMRIHTGERPFACQMCPRRFSEHGTLKCHMRTHTGEKPYECHVCDKKFSENSTLRRHILTHTGERPFECETCHSKFIQKYNLNNHIRRVHTRAALGL